MTARRVLHGALVADGTRSPARPLDVLVEDGTIAEMAPDLSAVDAERVDLTGLVLAPGFIDLHTHFDAQVFWDQELSPSSWYGVTTVVAGNCGFGVAPALATSRSTIARTLEGVEGMSYAALAAGIPPSFETFPEYLDAVDALPLAANFATFVGHTPLRLRVMGDDDGYERHATADEVAAICRLAVEAVDAGALGVASSKGASHVGMGARPVPSRVAAIDELRALFSSVADRAALSQFNAGPEVDAEEVTRWCAEDDGRLTWTALVTGLAPRGSAVDRLDRLAALGGPVWPQISALPVVMQTGLANPYPFTASQQIRAITQHPPGDRAARYRSILDDPVALAEIDVACAHRWHRTSVQETARHGDLIGIPLDELAGPTGSPAATMIELALEEELATRFRVILANDDEVELAQLLQDDRTVIGLSDAGAHADQLCDAGFAAHVLGTWCRDRGVLALEDAVWRLTGQPAELLGLGDRGRIAVGMVADLVAFDADRIGQGPYERRRDLPTGAERLVTTPLGIEHVWVAGIPTRRSGAPVPEARPGRLLRRR